MKSAEEYKELTGNKSKFYTLMYEKSHPVIMNNIETVIMTAVQNNQYFASYEMSMLSEYDIKMILKVLQYYGFGVNWDVISNTDESCQSGILTIHWS